uniref:Uncharacterized protein n=1 Tax=Desmodus rotundus TaxID=9430 RepID=K9IGA9_DESRO
MLDLLKLSQKLLILSSFFWIHFFPCHSDWLLFASLCSKSLIYSQLHLLSCCFPKNCSLFQLVCPLFLTRRFFFTLLRSSLSSLSILITSVLNSASDTLLMSISFSSFSGVLICSFIWSMFLCLLCWFLCVR